MGQVFDVGIIGAGVAGTFAAYKISKNNKNIKVLMIESGRPSRKRRTQMNGFLGLLPNSDGKLFLNNLIELSKITSSTNIKNTFNWFKQETKDTLNFNTIKDTAPFKSITNKIKKTGFNIDLQNYIQLIPQEIHNLSKYISDFIEENNNIKSIYDTEVIKINKEKSHFTIATELDDFKCKKILVAVGRSGWRWASELYSRLGIILNNDYANFGVRLEIADTSLKDFNKSNCILRRDDIEIGPFSWNGTVIPEDHCDMAISSFRSNESRWETDKVSFNLIGKRYFNNNGFEQTDRIGQLTFILTNDRVIKEKITTLMSKKAKISVMKEYDWILDNISEIQKFIPDILSKGYYHAPTLFPSAPQIKVRKSFETEVAGMYAAGESAGAVGILGAIISGSIAGDSLSK